MDKIWKWIKDNVLTEPLFWTALTLGLTTKAKEFGISENSPWLTLVQIFLGAAAASFLGGKINQNTALTKETKSIAVNTIGMVDEAQKTAVETKADIKDAIKKNGG